MITGTNASADAGRHSWLCSGVRHVDCAQDMITGTSASAEAGAGAWRGEMASERMSKGTGAVYLRPFAVSKKGTAGSSAAGNG